MRKLAIAAVLLAALTPWATPQEAAPLDPVLKSLSKFVGGKWVAEGDFPVEQEWSWNVDKRGLHVQTKIGKGLPSEMLAKAFFGWDPIAKQPYYLDMHGSDLTYYGHVTEKDGTFEFKFGQLGSGKKDWVERGKFSGEDEWNATLYQITDGKESPFMTFKLKRKR